MINEHSAACHGHAPVPLSSSLSSAALAKNTPWVRKHSRKKKLVGVCCLFSSMQCWEGGGHLCPPDRGGCFPESWAEGVKYHEKIFLRQCADSAPSLFLNWEWCMNYLNLKPEIYIIGRIFLCFIWAVKWDLIISPPWASFNESRFESEIFIIFHEVNCGRRGGEICKFARRLFLKKPPLLRKKNVQMCIPQDAEWLSLKTGLPGMLAVGKHLALLFTNAVSVHFAFIFLSHTIFTQEWVLIAYLSWKVADPTDQRHRRQSCLLPSLTPRQRSWEK